MLKQHCRTKTKTHHVMSGRCQGMPWRFELNCAALAASEKMKHSAVVVVAAAVVVVVVVVAVAAVAAVAAAAVVVLQMQTLER